MIGTNDGNKDVGRELVVLRAAERRLAECTELEEVIDIRDDAEVVRSMLQKRRAGLKKLNQAARLKLQAERKLGAALAAMHLRGGDRKSKSGRSTLILEDLGITRHQSSD